VKDFEWMYQTALKRVGDKQELEKRLPVPLSEKALKEQADSYYLSQMSRRIFRAGLKHALVDKKWPAFEQAFFQFNPLRVAMMSDDELDQLMANTAIIRHWRKIKATRNNASLLIALAEEEGNFATWLAQWPVDNIVGLWIYFRKHGSQLGGNSAASFLRMVGKDTFLITEDVVVALKAQGIIDKNPTSQRDLHKMQEAFNVWQQQSSRPLCQISRLLSMTVNY
jgi:3-methyladenine DNA glycosylase Tag